MKARARLFQKGLSSGPARARPGRVFLGLDPSLLKLPTYIHDTYILPIDVLNDEKYIHDYDEH